MLMLQRCRWRSITSFNFNAEQSPLPVFPKRLISTSCLSQGLCRVNCDGRNFLFSPPDTFPGQPHPPGSLEMNKPAASLAVSSVFSHREAAPSGSNVFLPTSTVEYYNDNSNVAFIHCNRTTTLETCFDYNKENTCFRGNMIQKHVF